MELLVIAIMMVIGAAFALAAVDLGADTRDLDENPQHPHHVGIG